MENPTLPTNRLAALSNASPWACARMAADTTSRVSNSLQKR